MKMKKAYSKPEILFEDFSVSSSIATGCAVISNNNVYDCKVTMPFGEDVSITLFAKGSCEYGYPGDYDNICYHVPTVSWNIYTS
jgi:hypothetical protein